MSVSADRASKRVNAPSQPSTPRPPHSPYASQKHVYAPTPGRSATATTRTHQPPRTHTHTPSKNRLTGGFTNHAVSHPSSAHSPRTNASTSRARPASSTRSSAVGSALRTSPSIVTPHSARAPMQVGSVSGAGGGASEPVKPHNPSWSTRGAIAGGRVGGKIGRRVQMRLCSTSLGTAVQEGKGVREGGGRRGGAYRSRASRS